MHIEDGPQTVAGVGLETTPIAVLGGLVEIITLADELFELWLHVHDLLGGEFELDYRDTGCFKVCKETNFGRLQEYEGPAAAV
jgi:hypothetical protein